MNKHTLHRTVSNQSCIQKISFHDYISFNYFLFVPKFRGIKMAQFKPHWKGTYINIHFRITYNSSNIFY